MFTELMILNARIMVEYGMKLYKKIKLKRYYRTKSQYYDTVS